VIRAARPAVRSTASMAFTVAASRRPSSWAMMLSPDRSHEPHESLEPPQKRGRVVQRLSPVCYQSTSIQMSGSPM
jgi:hypothetical protein